MPERELITIQGPLRIHCPADTSRAITEMMSAATLIVGAYWVWLVVTGRLDLSAADHLQPVARLAALGVRLAGDQHASVTPRSGRPQNQPLGAVEHWTRSDETWRSKTTA